MHLVGRERELGELRGVLDTERIVTVWGPAGVGKTRLVREALGPTARVCSLVRMRSHDEVLEALARVLGVARGDAPLEVTVVLAPGRGTRY